MSDPVFIVALCCAKKVMCLTLNLSRALQTVNKDLIEAMEGVGFVIRTLKSWRTDEKEWISDEFGSFSLAQQLAERIGVNITTPRLASRQNHRNNVPANNACEYFRRAVWFPYLDAILESFNSRFSRQNTLVTKMSYLIPSEISDCSWDDIKESIELYRSILDVLDSEEIRLQVMEWKDFCSKLMDKPKTPLEALDIVPKRMAIIRRILQIFCTVPVTSCSAERAFSAMKVLKNFLRNRMRDERLTGLALLYIHQEIGVDIEEVINRFSSSSVKRRLDFVI